MTINRDLLTTRERDAYDNRYRYSPFAAGYIEALTESLCAARQAAADALLDLNGATNADEAINRNGLVYIAIARLERVKDRVNEPVVCALCEERPVTFCDDCGDEVCAECSSEPDDNGAVACNVCADDPLTLMLVSPGAQPEPPHINTEPVS